MVSNVRISLITVSTKTFRNHNNLNCDRIFRAKRQLALIPLNRMAALPAALGNLTRPGLYHHFFGHFVIFTSTHLPHHASHCISTVFILNPYTTSFIPNLLPSSYFVLSKSFSLCVTLLWSYLFHFLYFQYLFYTSPNSLCCCLGSDRQSPS